MTGRFDERFSGFAGRRILLHGSRAYAEAILDRFDDRYHFLGVMTRDEAGETFRGKPVYPESALAELKPDLVILTERVKYAEAVYEAIAETCRAEGIALFDMYGIDEPAMHRSLESCRNHTLSGWQEIAAPYDVVAFELMDTFLSLSMLRGKPCVRGAMKELARSLIERGVPLCFSLRRSYPEQEQIRYLWETGLFPTREAMEACLIRRSGEDLSFRSLRERYPDAKILYIGMGLVYECILPRYYGIDTYRMLPHIDSLFPRRPQDPGAEAPNAWSRERLDRMLRECDAVSFDIFDTLLVRMTLLPSDVFGLVEARARREGIPAPDFAGRRAAAQGELPLADIGAIYRRIGQVTGWPQETLDALLALETETERSVLLPREPMVGVLREAVRLGKRVVVTSDMYLPARILERILDEKGIRGYEAVFVSCEEGCRKADGLFGRVREYLGTENVLHIGDDPDADLLPAQAAGFRGFYVPSALRTALDCGWERSVDCAGSLTERCLVGQSVALSFMDPFIPHAIGNMQTDARLRRYAFGAVAPMVAGYLTWLAAELRDTGTDRVLFLARDGWLPMEGYELLRKRFPGSSLPEPVYCYLNRRAAFLGVCGTYLETFLFDAKARSNGLSPDRVLSHYFDLDAEEILPWKDGEQTPDRYMRKHAAAVRARQRQAREGLARYARSLGLRQGERYAVVDFVAMGSTQAFLERILPLTLTGYYFAQPRYENEGSGCAIRYYLRGENDFFVRNYMETEHFMTSPEPSVDHIAEDGTPVLAEELRSDEDLRQIRVVAEAVRTYLRTFFGLFYEPGETVSPGLTEELYAADGYHWVLREAYDDWGKQPLR